MFLLGICIELIYSVKTTSIGISTGIIVQTHPNTSPSTDISLTGHCILFHPKWSINKKNTELHLCP